MKPIHSRWWLGAVTLAALALRLARLDFQPLWWDEGYSVFFATRDLATLFARTALDIHPPLYYALLQLWIALVGKSPVAVRLLSVGIGVATVPLAYAFARKLFDARIALIAATLLAFSPFHIYYSQEVRMYGLVTLLGLGSAYFFAQLLTAPTGTRTSFALALAYITTTTAALYTQYYAAFIVATQILIVVIRQRAQIAPLIHASFKFNLAALWKNPLAHWLGAWVAAALLYAPWVVYAGPQLYAYVTAKVGIEKYPPLDPLTFLAQHLAALVVGHLTAWTWLAWASVAMLALVALGFSTPTQKTKLSQSPGLLVTLSFLMPLTLGYLVNLVYPFHPVHGERLLLFVAPMFCTLAAHGSAMLWRRRAILGALALSVVAAISAASLADFYTTPRYPNDDYRPLIAEMQTLAQSDDTFLAIYPWQIGYLETYYIGAPLRIVETPNAIWIKDAAQMQSAVNALRERDARVWLPALQTQGRILEDVLDARLRERAFSALDTWHGTTRLELFVFAADPPLPRAPRNILFEDGAALRDLGISREPVAAGAGSVRLRFFGETRANTQISLRLLDAAGNVWAQSDRDMARDLQRLALPIPAGTPPGAYDLRVTAYRARDNTPLAIKDSPQTSVSLTQVQVVAPVQPNRAAIPQRAEIDFGNGVRLLGFDAPPAIKPGMSAPITLFWQATRSLDRDYLVAAQLRDARGNSWATMDAPFARGNYPPTRWQPGELVRDPQTLTLRGDAPDGEYRLVIALIDPTGARTPPREIGAIAAKGRAHYFGAPAPANRSDARFGDSAQLVGYELQSDARVAHMTLYWRALAASETAYTVFVHLVDANGVLRAQGDQIPGAGTYPTTTWVKGEYLADGYTIAAPPGEYAIRIGMYDAATGARLPVFAATGQPVGDYSELATRVTVR